MDSPTLILTDLPELSDQSAGQLHDFLSTFVYEFEERYNTQLRRYYLSLTEPTEMPDDDFVPDFDELPF